MAREWIQYPKDIQIDTDFGPVFLSVVQGDYVYVDAHGNGKFITYRGKKYSVWLRLHTYDGGKTWGPNRDKDSHGRLYDYVGAKPHGSFDINAKMAPTFRNKVVEHITARVTEYLKSNPHLLAEAGIAEANNDLARIEEEVDSAEAAYNLAMAKMVVAKEKLEEAEKHAAATPGTKLWIEG